MISFTMYYSSNAIAFQIGQLYHIILGPVQLQVSTLASVWAAAATARVDELCVVQRVLHPRMQRRAERACAVPAHLRHTGLHVEHARKLQLGGV